MGLATLLLFFMACNGGGGPSGPDPGVDVTGTWEFSASKVGGGFDNSRSFTTTSVLRITQEGGTISGTHSNTRSISRNCTDGIGCFADSKSIPTGPVNGTVRGRSVTIRFDTDSSTGPESFEGTVQGDRIQGDGWEANRVAGGAGGEAATLAAPTGLRATVDPRGPAVDLAWRDNAADEDGYGVLSLCGSETEFELIGTVPANATGARVTFGGPGGGVLCSYVVFAYRQVGPEDFVFSDPSNVVTVVVP